MKKVLVTGACGFIGQALCRYLLKKGVEVIGFVLEPGKVAYLQEFGMFRVMRVPFESYPEIDKIILDRDIDVVYHLAWDGTSGEKFKDYALQLANARYACDMLMASIAIKSKKFILAGTVNQLEIQKHLTLNKSEPRFSCLYGTAKLAAEMICKTLAFQFGISFNQVLLANVYGPGDNSRMLQNVLIHNFLANTKPRLVEGNFLYDWIYIDDVVRLLEAVGHSGVSQKRYYIGHRELQTFKDIVLKVRNILNPDIECLFGEYPDSNLVDYDLIDINALYLDTGVEAEMNFNESILLTADWVKSLDFA